MMDKEHLSKWVLNLSIFFATLFVVLWLVLMGVKLFYGT